MSIPKQPKFEFLDGLRGLCAVYVALYHTALFTGHGDEKIPVLLKPLHFLLGFGHYAVAVFIVLSGFCLTIPVALSEDKRLRGGFKRYIRRRFRRIIPPYYVALLLFLVLIAVTPLLQQPLRTAWDNKIPVDWKTVVTHFLLVHNLHADWIYKIDGPMWSVATEWQIYFFFPLLLFIWRKTNLLYAVLAGLFIGTAAGFKLAILHPWYLGLFALGMAAAILSFSPDEFFVQWRNKINWRVQVRIWMPLLVVFLLLSWYRHIPAIVCETFVGFVMCIVIVHYTLVDVRNDKADAFLQLLKSTPVVTLGVFSYSIYLVHSPIIALVNLLALDAPMSYGFRMLFMLLLAAPLAIACAYLFYVLVEKRFLSTHARKEARVLNIQ